MMLRLASLAALCASASAMPSVAKPSYLSGLERPVGQPSTYEIKVRNDLPLSLRALLRVP